jgi:molybdopterin synthase catalytic subunit
MTATIRLQREPFDAAREVTKLTHRRTDIGAIVTFTGICRGDEAGAPLVAMTLEHYPEMAEAEVARQLPRGSAGRPRRDQDSSPRLCPGTDRLSL